ncbi:MAG: DUF4112 domain-containing protein, partial [Deltaproteobacteria bacterium]|nr:DUF4112 domain-containing protein [Deltaproteobacteria bacterium]
QDSLKQQLRQAAARGALPGWAARLVHLLDHSIRIPGTRFGIGWDAILGALFPALGDGATAVGSVSLLLLALRQKVPTVVIARMVLNIVVDAVGGVLPVVGDTFDLFFKSNSRNLALLQRFSDQPKSRATLADHAIVGLGILVAIGSVVGSLLLFYALSFGGLVALFSLLQSLIGRGGGAGGGGGG